MKTNVTAVSTPITNLTADLSTVTMRDTCKYSKFLDLIELFSGSTKLRNYIDMYGNENTNKTSILPNRQEIVRIVAEDMRADLKKN